MKTTKKRYNNAMFYYAFVIYFDFETIPVSEEEFKDASSLKYNRHYSRDLHNRGADTFGYTTPYVSSMDYPYVDEKLDEFLDEMLIYYDEMRDFIISHKGTVSVCILYDNEDEEVDNERFNGYMVTRHGIEILHYMDAYIASDQGFAKDIIFKK